MIAAWHRRGSLDKSKAKQLWAVHRWQPISPPPDVATLLANNQPLAVAQQWAAAQHQTINTKRSWADSS